MISFLFLSISSQAQKFNVQCLNMTNDADIFSPAFYKDQLVVCSNKKDRIFSTIIDESNKEPVNLFLFNPKDTSRLEPFSSNLKSKFNDGPISFNADFTKAVFSKNLTNEKNKSVSDKDNYVLGIYFSELIGESWTEPIALPFNNSNTTNSHPTLSKDGKLIVFTSNREGGIGGYDLWYSIFTDKWSEPINCGNLINSEANELFPVINDGLLFFSSTRNGGFGMMDIYYSNLNSSIKPNHLPEPINSTFDDFGLITNDQINTGYFSSNRKNMDKIFSFDYKFPDFENCTEQVYDDFCYTLYEENAIQLNVESLIYRWKINDVQKKGVSIDYCFEKEGVYEISLDIQDTVLNETYYNQANYQVLIEYTQQPFITSKDTVSTNEPFLASAEFSNLPYTEILEYYWEHGNGRKSFGKTIEIEYNQPGNYNIQLGIIGKEGDSMVKYCSTKTIYCGQGINSNLIFPNLIPGALNDTNLITSAEYFDPNSYNEKAVKFSIELGVYDTSSFETKNKVLEYLKKDSINKINLKIDTVTNIISYRIGEWDSVTGPYATWVELKKTGFKDAVVKSYTAEDLSKIFEIDKPFILSDVVFDTDSYALNETTKAELEKLITIMINVPSFGLNIAGHTDNRGTSAHNLELSKNRTLTIKNYMISRGIPENRILHFYYGANSPIASNETIEGKQKNRRVEFKFIIIDNER